MHTLVRCKQVKCFPHFRRFDNCPFRYRTILRWLLKIIIQQPYGIDFHVLLHYKKLKRLVILIKLHYTPMVWRVVQRSCLYTEQWLDLCTSLVTHVSYELTPHNAFNRFLKLPTNFITNALYASIHQWVIFEGSTTGKLPSIINTKEWRVIGLAPIWKSLWQLPCYKEAAYIFQYTYINGLYVASLSYTLIISRSNRWFYLKY